MADKLGLDQEVHELKLGRSFDGGSSLGYHSIRYDFKPASVDTSQVAGVDVGEGNSVTITVPHVEGSGTSHTLYKGNKRPCQKECLLIIDHKTGEFTLEKLVNNIQVKKTRAEGSSKAHLHRPMTPTEKLKELKEMKDHKNSPAKRKVSPPSTTSQASPKQTAPSGGSQPTPSQLPTLPPAPTPSVPAPTPAVPAKPREVTRLAEPEAEPYSPTQVMSGSSSSSDSEDDTKPEPPPVPASVGISSNMSNKNAHHGASTEQKGGYRSMLSMDLQLSESGSDSD